MTKEEILQKIQNEEVTQEDLFNYYGVRNMQGLEIALEDKFLVPQVNINYVVQGFEFIYKARLDDDYNPLEEKFRYLSILLPAFYGMETNDATIIIRPLGIFEGTMFLENLIKDKPEVKYFNELYEKFLDRKKDIGILLEENFDKLNKFIGEKLTNLKMEDLKDLGKTVMVEIEKLNGKVN